MGTVRVEHCPDCGAMIGEGTRYEHQQKHCPARHVKQDLQSARQFIEQWCAIRNVSPEDTAKVLRGDLAKAQADAETLTRVRELAKSLRFAVERTGFQHYADELDALLEEAPQGGIE